MWSWLAKLGDLAASEASSPWGASVPPLFDSFERRGSLVVLGRKLDPKCDLGLQDHRINGIPVLPGVLGVELMLQAAVYVARRPLDRLEQVHFSVPVKLFHDLPLTVEVEARATPDAIEVALVSLFRGPSGQVLRREHFTAVAPLVPRALAPEGPRPPLEMPGDSPIEAQEIYQRYFHGPAFQVLEAVLRLGDNGADAALSAPKPEWLKGVDPSSCLSAPRLREAGFQAAGLWEMAELGRMALPSAIDVLYAAPKLLQTARGAGAGAGTELPCGVLEARRREVEAHGVVFDVWLRGQDGPPSCLMQGYRTVTLRDLNAEERFEPRQHRPAVPNLVQVEVAEMAPLLEDEAALTRLLSPAERRHLAGLKVHKRRIEWLAVRMAAKRLLREAYFGHDNAIVLHHAITIGNDALGAPTVEVVGALSDPQVALPLPRISLSHSAGQAVAYLAPTPDTWPGVDLEPIEARDPSFAATYFTASERAWALNEKRPEVALTALWAVKEAALKALGIGARVDLREVEVSGADNWALTFHGEAAAQLRQAHRTPSHIEVTIEDTWVLAKVLMTDLPSSSAALKHSAGSASTTTGAAHS